MQTLGAGGHGKVFMCKIEGLQGYYASKVFSVPSDEHAEAQLIKDILEEFELARDLNHPCVI